MIAELHFRSACLDKDTAANVFLPDAASAADCPVVTLLHGMHGNYDSWLRKTHLETIFRGREIAILMPEGGNSFYQDMKYGEKYFTFITEEFPDLMRRTFGFSDKRENNYIAGLSMGGYGAFRTALLLPERYAGAASLSGCLDMTTRLKDARKHANAVLVWGEDFEKTVPGSDSDTIHLVRNFPADKPAPRLFFACGTEDPLYYAHVNMRAALEERKDVFDFVCEDGPGAHNWVFWDAWIERALNAIIR